MSENVFSGSLHYDLLHRILSNSKALCKALHCTLHLMQIKIPACLLSVKRCGLSCLRAAVCLAAVPPTSTRCHCDQTLKLYWSEWENPQLLSTNAKSTHKAQLSADSLSWCDVSAEDQNLRALRCSLIRWFRWYLMQVSNLHAGLIVTPQHLGQSLMFLYQERQYDDYLWSWLLLI